MGVIAPIAMGVAMAASAGASVYQAAEAKKQREEAKAYMEEEKKKQQTLLDEEKKRVEEEKLDRVQISTRDAQLKSQMQKRASAADGGGIGNVGGGASTQPKTLLGM